MNLSTTEKIGKLEISSIPARAGIGLKPQHFSLIINEQPDIAWFEVHPENYMMAGGPMLHYLNTIRNDYPISFHSVGMSLGSADGIDSEHLFALKSLIERFQPAFVSDHLSWSRWQQTSLNDLLPMPYTKEALKLMSDNLDQVQNILGRKIAVENPSSYFDLSDTEMDECDFLIQLTQDSGASILLDINNIYVNASNHGWSAKEYIQRIPKELVSEIHLAGHAVQDTEVGPIRIDDHGSEVSEEVWQLFAFAIEHLGERPTLIEWDTNIPELPILLKEAELADNILLNLSTPAAKVAHHG